MKTRSTRPARPARTKSRHKEPAPPSPDLNAVVAGVLSDLSAIQTSTFKARGYARAATAVLMLDRQLDRLVAERGHLPAMAGVGTSSAKVISEIVAHGESPTADRAVRAGGHAVAVEGYRSLRDHVISRAAAFVVLLSPAPKGVIGAEDYRSDLQMHSTWSDGRASLAEMAAGSITRGYQHAAVTDHSAGLKIARGMTPERARDQRKDIDTLNAGQAGRFRLIAGIEANILSDGRLDISEAEARAFEIVLAAAHSGTRDDGDQTARLLAAVRQPYVDVLAHPRGRKAGVRAGLHADWDGVFDAAAHANVAVEFDGDPARQDLDYAIARRALAAGCLFAVSSDAHAPEELAYADIALAHARLAGVPKERVINCWETPKLLEWLAARRGAQPKPPKRAKR